MEKIIILPTWILARLLIPFLPKNHILKKKKITLVDWTLNATALNYVFAFYFWIAIILIITIFHKSIFYIFYL